MMKLRREERLKRMIKLTACLIGLSETAERERQWGNLGIGREVILKWWWPRNFQQCWKTLIHRSPLNPKWDSRRKFTVSTFYSTSENRINKSYHFGSHCPDLGHVATTTCRRSWKMSVLFCCLFSYLPQRTLRGVFIAVREKRSTDIDTDVFPRSHS